MYVRMFLFVSSAHIIKYLSLARRLLLYIDIYTFLFFQSPFKRLGTKQLHELTEICL